MPEFDIRVFMQGLKSLDDKDNPLHAEECWHQLFAQATFLEQVHGLMECAVENGRGGSPRVIRTMLAVALSYYDNEMNYEEEHPPSKPVREARHRLHYLLRATDERIGPGLVVCREKQDLGLLRELIGYVHQQLPTEDTERFAHEYLWGDGKELAQNFLEQCFSYRSISAGGQDEWLYENLTLCMDELIAIWAKTDALSHIWPGANRAEPYAEGNESYPRRHRAVVASLSRFVAADSNHRRGRARDELMLYYLERREYLRRKEQELSGPNYGLGQAAKRRKEELEAVRAELATIPEI